VSVSNTKRSKKAGTSKRKLESEAAIAPETAPQGPISRPSADFERELRDHFAAEERKKVEEATENIFGTVLARHGWIRNEHGQVEYVGGEGA